MKVRLSDLCTHLEDTVLPHIQRDEWGSASESLCQLLEFLERNAKSMLLTIPDNATGAHVAVVVEGCTGFGALTLPEDANEEEIATAVEAYFEDLKRFMKWEQTVSPKDVSARAMAEAARSLGAVLQEGLQVLRREPASAIRAALRKTPQVADAEFLTHT